MNFSRMVYAAGGILQWTFVLAVVVAVWLVYRNLFKPKYGHGRFLPSTAPKPSRLARWADALILGASAAVVLVISATTSSTGGLLLMLDEISRSYAIANVIMLVCALAGAALALLFVLRGRAAAGTIIMAVVLIGYGFVLNGGSAAGAWFLPGSMIHPGPEIQYTISISGADVQGAELWVNGVRLGPLPYTTRYEDFLAKVPYWPEPPADYDTDKAEIPEYSDMGAWIRNERRWIKINLPNPPSPTPWNEDYSRPKEKKTYYARVQYAGEWGLAGNGSSSGGGGSRITYQMRTNFNVVFPERQKRLTTLLNMARLADYHVGPDWLVAIESYRDDGWDAVRQAAAKEPEMMQVADAWASWRYHLDQVNDADSAWSALEQIRDEAKRAGRYETDSPAGHAVEMLTSRLASDRLLDGAVNVIQNTGVFGVFTWETDGQMQYGIQPHGSIGRGNQYMGGGTRNGSRSLMAEDLVILHAAGVLYTTQPELVRDRLAPEIVRWQYQSGLIEPLLMAARMGGTEVDTFFLRQNWMPMSSTDSYRDQLLSSFGDVNKWLYLLANLDDEAGRQFRRRNASLIMSLADELTRNEMTEPSNAIDFIFRDPQLARDYWPQYSSLVRQRRSEDVLRMQWQYLVRMGSAATPEMFVDAWRNTTLTPYVTDRAWDMLWQVPEELRGGVIQALVAEARANPDHLKELSDRARGKSTVEYVTLHLESKSTGSQEESRSRRTFVDMQSPGSTIYREHVPLWLANTAPDSRLVELLVTAEDPELRAMACPALLAYPTPSRRKLLDQLLHDVDPEVRTAAESAQSNLKQLHSQSPALFSTDPSAGRSDAATQPAALR